MDIEAMSKSRELEEQIKRWRETFGTSEVRGNKGFLATLEETADTPGEDQGGNLRFSQEDRTANQLPREGMSARG